MTPFTLMKGIVFQDAAIFVNINNQAMKHFDLCTGFRQGWPSAPYLF